jgi:hypothetical protein
MHCLQHYVFAEYYMLCSALMLHNRPQCFGVTLCLANHREAVVSSTVAACIDLTEAGTCYLQ